MKKDIYTLLRNNSRTSLTDYSKKNGLSVKKVHYEYDKIKKNNVAKFVSVLDFESLCFYRIIIIFHDAIEGLAISSLIKPFYVNNSIRLDSGLFVEYIFFFKNEIEEFLQELNKQNVSFFQFHVDKIIKQEGFLLD